MNTSAQATTVLDLPVRQITGAKILPLPLRGRIREAHNAGIDKFSLDERISYLRRYGDHCMSFSAMQPGMHYFDVPGIGYIAYKMQWGSKFVLADPVCDEKDREFIISEFLKDGKGTAFAQISEPVAELIAEKFGYYSTQFGVETIVDLEDWNLKGKKKQVLRTSINKAQKDGIHFIEKDHVNGDRKLTDEWLKTRKVRNREILFLIRPMDMDYEEGTRRFYAYKGDELLGFIYFDPIYSDNKVVSYVPNISRFSHNFKQGIFYPLMVYAMETFKSEGLRYMHLGLSPMVVDDKDLYYESSIVKKMIRLLYKYGNMVYSFKGLHFTKSRFQGTDCKTFCAHKEKLPIKSFLSMFKLANIL
ncbi:MAG TPA: DUF2156 domain-containing protein [Deltaproteobacteria bacterium]|nr:DUF2156 domain-containing protein [Deltaproteobacteria bacterium]